MIFRMLQIAAAVLLLPVFSASEQAEKRPEIGAVKATEVVFGKLSEDDVTKADRFSIVDNRNAPPKLLLSDKGFARLSEAFRGKNYWDVDVTVYEDASPNGKVGSYRTTFLIDARTGNR